MRERREKASGGCSSGGARRVSPQSPAEHPFCQGVAALGAGRVRAAWQGEPGDDARQVGPSGGRRALGGPRSGGREPLPTQVGGAEVGGARGILKKRCGREARLSQSRRVG